MKGNRVAHKASLRTETKEVPRISAVATQRELEQCLSIL